MGPFCFAQTNSTKIDGEMVMWRRKRGRHSSTRTAIIIIAVCTGLFLIAHAPLVAGHAHRVPDSRDSHEQTPQSHNTCKRQTLPLADLADQSGALIDAYFITIKNPLPDKAKTVQARRQSMAQQAKATGLNVTPVYAVPLSDGCVQRFVRKQTRGQDTRKMARREPQLASGMTCWTLPWISLTTTSRSCRISCRRCGAMPRF